MRRLLKKLMDLPRPLFEEGGKLHILYPLFEAGETFCLTPGKVAKGQTHVRDPLDMKRVMIMVVVALIPCVLLGMYNAGLQYETANQIEGANFWTHWYQGALMVLPIIIVSYLFGGLWEVFFAVLRKEDITEGFLVTGLLFPLTLPPTIPLWQVAIGISFGVLIGKEIFGGTGYNIVNPALLARAFLFFAYPGQISGDQVWTKINAGAVLPDGFSGATPLAIVSSVTHGSAVEALNTAGHSLASMALGLEGGSIGETSLWAVLAGALILNLFGIASWRIMLGGVAGLLGTAFSIHLLAGDSAAAFTHLPAYYHLVMGSFAFGIVFMATDPVSAAATPAGKWIYGALIGFLTIIIRVTNPAYPEGTMLSILFMNIMAPLVDHAVVRVHVRRRTRSWRTRNA